MDLSDRFLIVHRSAFYLGLCIILLGILAATGGALAWYAGQFFLPSPIWFAAAVPTTGVGGTFVACSITRPN